MSWGGCGEAKDSRGTPHRSLPVIRGAEPRNDGRTGSAAAPRSFLRSRRPVLLPEHTAASGRHRGQRHDVSGVVEGLYRQVRENRGLVRPGVPTPPQTDDRLVHPVKDTRNDPAAVEADQVYVGQSATNLVMATNADPVSVSRDSLWWISDHL